MDYHYSQELVFAKRQMLAELGLRYDGTLTSVRRVKIEEFQGLANMHPHIYGDFETTSDKWKRGLLAHLNESGALAWEDVEEWMGDPNFMEFLKVLRAPHIPHFAQFGRYGKVIAAKETDELAEMQVQQWEHAIIKSDRCDKMLPVRAKLAKGCAELDPSTKVTKRQPELRVNLSSNKNRLNRDTSTVVVKVEKADVVKSSLSELKKTTSL